MKTLTIGSTTLEITSCTRRRDTQRGFFLDLVIPKSSIGMDELYALLDGNTEPIVVVDADGTENTYLGFKETGSFALEGGAYHVAQICTSEYEAQLSLAQTKIAAQDETIAMQTQQMCVLEEMNMMQLSTIDSLLLEVIPAVIADTIAEALASNSTPEVE